MGAIKRRIRGTLHAWQAAWQRHRALRLLSSVTSRQQLSKIIDREAPEYFLFSAHTSAERRSEFVSVADFLRIDVENCDFLDIGPGYGDALDVCHERGARSITFVEWDPFFCAHNRLKGYATEHCLNHLRQLHRLPERAFDLIWSKGCISADHFERRRRRPRLRHWLDQLHQRARPGARVLLCPHWQTRHNERVIEHPARSAFAQILGEAGYEILPSIRRHNTLLTYPVTFSRTVTEPP